MTKKEFIDKMNLACCEAELKKARFNRAVIFAQAALESNWGNSELVRKANNLFSIKAGYSWKGKTIKLPGPEWSNRLGWYQDFQQWRIYESWCDCILDYAKIIAEAPWFQDALQYVDQPEEFLKALLPDNNHPGWATDPGYFQKITKIAAELENYGGPKWNKR
ncbi:MAG TPA: hypothetical protein DDW50_08455 [Firmicutes bacterium]|jgi:flagellum-specific peptidoglycan hydrolase FlgJ|nr:hypothetical protein [Bacillota bacterium]